MKFLSGVTGETVGICFGVAVSPVDFSNNPSTNGPQRKLVALRSSVAVLEGEKNNGRKWGLVGSAWSSSCSHFHLWVERRSFCSVLSALSFASYFQFYCWIRVVTVSCRATSLPVAGEIRGPLLAVVAATLFVSVACSMPKLEFRFIAVSSCSP